MHNEKQFYKVSKYNNEEFLKEQQERYNKFTNVQTTKVEQQQNNSNFEVQRFIMKWTNSVCADNHHYVIQGKLNGWGSEPFYKFTSKIYLKTPGNNLF